MCAGWSDDEELPVVQLSAHHSSSSGCGLVIPDAAEVAAEREREARALQALSRLRQDEPDLQVAGVSEDRVGSGRQDSSGSEGEAALAAAVRALRVHRPQDAHAAPAPPPLLAALAAMAPPHVAPALHAIVNLQRHANARTLPYLRQISEALSSCEEADLGWAMSALCVLSAGGPRGRHALQGGRHALQGGRHALQGGRHALQGAAARAAPAAAAQAAALLLRAVRQANPPHPSSVLMRLADAARGESEAAGRLCDALLEAAARAELEALAPPAQLQGAAQGGLAEGALAALVAASAALAPGRQLAVLRAAGRLLARRPRPAAPALQAALAPLTRRRDNHPASFKVCVAAGQLRLLLVPDAARAQ